MTVYCSQVLLLLLFLLLLSKHILTKEVTDYKEEGNARDCKTYNNTKTEHK